MALRDFDRVRERIVLRLEVRHVVQFTLAMLAVAGACFLAGYRVGQDAAPDATIVRKPLNIQASSLAPSPRQVATIAAVLAEPVVPKPLAPTPAPLAPQADVVLHALTAQDREAATAAGERVVPADKPQAAETPESAKSPEPAETPEPAEVAKAPAVSDATPVAAEPVPIEAPPAAPIQLTVAWPGIGFWRSATVPTSRPVARTKVVAAAPRHMAPAAPAQPGPPRVVVGERFVVQVKAFRNEPEALAFQAQLLEHGHHTTLSTIEVPGKGTFYRIRLGPFLTVEVAKAAQRKFEQAEGHATILLVVGGPAQASATP
jgi:DedD protein